MDYRRSGNRQRVRQATYLAATHRVRLARQRERTASEFADFTGRQMQS
jgi:hypothetical protein